MSPTLTNTQQVNQQALNTDEFTDSADVVCRTDDVPMSLNLELLPDTFADSAPNPSRILMRATLNDMTRESGELVVVTHVLSQHQETSRRMQIATLQNGESREFFVDMSELIAPIALNAPGLLTMEAVIQQDGRQVNSSALVAVAFTVGDDGAVHWLVAEEVDTITIGDDERVATASAVYVNKRTDSVEVPPPQNDADEDARTSEQGGAP